jgi:sugar lactone lactonase YvrE
VRLLVCLLALASACDDRTSVLVDIEGARPLRSLDLTVTLPSHDLHRPLGALTPPRSLLILLPDEAQKVDLSLEGVEESGRVVAAQATFQSVPHQKVQLTLSLAGPGDDLSVTPDLSGVDLTGYVEDLANADLTLSGDLAGADFAVVPSLSVLAGVPGGSTTWDATGRDARLASPGQAALVGTSLYTFEFFSGRLRKIDVTTGVATTVPLINSSDSQPYLAGEPVGLVADGMGHLYVACYGDHTIRKINLSDGKVSIVAGAANTPGSTDSPPRFNEPMGLAFDGNGDLWVADSSNYTVRKIALAGPTVTTPAGTPGANDFTDGNGAAGHFLHPKGLAFYNGDLYVTDSNGLRKVVVSASPAPVSTVLAEGIWNDGEGIASAGGGTLYVVEVGQNTLRRVTLGGPSTQVVVAGVASYTADFVDGVGVAARYTDPRWLVLDGAGAGYLSEAGAVRKIDLGNFNVTTLAGMSPQDDSTDSPRARFSEPAGMVFDGNDSIYVADFANNRIRKVTLSTGNVSTFAGNGNYASVDGQGASASFYSPINLVRDNSGNLYVSDFSGHCIRRITPAGDVKTIAGLNSIQGMPSPSPVPGAQARFSNPNGLALDGDHTLWVADSGSNTLRAIDLSTTDFVTSWVAGSGVSGDGPGVGRTARLNSPEGLAYDVSQKLLYIAGYDGLVRRLDMANPVSPAVDNLVGVAFANTPMDGSYANAAFGRMGELVFDPAKNVLWVADSGFDAVRRIDLTATMVTSPIGTLQAHLTKPGPLPAFVESPWGIALTPRGIVVSSWDENTLLLATGL